MTKTKIIIIIVLVITSAVLATTYMLPLLNKPKVQTPKESAFGNLNKPKIISGNGKLSPDIEEKYQNDPEGKMIFKYGWGLEIENPNIVWDKDTVAISATIEEYEPDSKTATLKFTTPFTSPVYQITKNVSLPTDCNATNTFVVDTTSDATSTDKDFFKQLKKGAVIKSFCIDDNCESLGKMCKVYSDQIVNN